MITEAPNCAYSRDAHWVRLILRKAAHSSLQESGHHLGGLVLGKLGGQPQAAAQQEGVDRAVHVGQHHVGQEVGDVKVNLATGIKG